MTMRSSRPACFLSRSGEMRSHVHHLDPRWDPLRKNSKTDALLTKHEVKL
jgi:hypothetical protein